MRKSLVALSVLAASLSAATQAADYTDGNIHKNDYKWSQFNLMYAFDELPGESSHDYLEMEFGGRSGIFDLYGYVDIFNLTGSPDSDKANADAKMFMKFAPRVSLDAVTGADLSFGPVQELYIASELTWDGVTTNATKGTFGVNNYKVGLGSDVIVPWLGKIGLNLYKTYDMNAKDWNGYQISTNWFKPFYTFDNGSFMSYQGYIDYQFAMNDDNKNLNTANGGAMFNGIYWHSDRYAVGYGLKAYQDVYGLKDGGWAGKTSGVSHYVSVTYKF
ncbi:outer membrane protein OmpK [Photobacterium sp. CCB-ST2H9]|uniref:nucleoside-specific channel-forming Tsx family protein n=1 Tax=Photobacterium sp. CCB-ST2H9 TaxID=2912855 RepID=UPI00200344DF|nr:outer membrane protein OmpK [Photobacterium sp. CCB-ST2H9]UTM58009.1 outer membrane protein OmpK [Photobacterium sp. CCB-ST2H9]